ncbi:MAG: hypothetical protein ABIL09_03395 [Gemmatimonadota bacterium]
MSPTQQATSLRAFAAAMLAADPAFAEALARYQASCGEADADRRALLAQAAYFCWYHGEYQANLLSTCRAIGAGRPTHLYLCGQLTPARWVQVHAYAVAVQRWLGRDAPVPARLDEGRLARATAWLGEPTAARQALAELFLCQLVDHLVRRATFSVLTDGPPPEAGVYADFCAWYLRPDGAAYGLGAGDPGQACPGESRGAGEDGSQPTDGALVSACAAAARRALAADAAAAEELIAGILRPSQPPGMHRFDRYQDIKLVSIGQLRWRAGLPPDDSRDRWQVFWDAAGEGLRSWLEGRAPGSRLAAALREALDVPTPASRFIVAELLLQPPPGQGCFDWLLRAARAQGAAPRLPALAEANAG